MHEKLEYVTTLLPEIIERPEKELGVDDEQWPAMTNWNKIEVGRIYKRLGRPKTASDELLGNRRIFPKTQRRLKFNFFLHLFKTLYD